MITIGRTTVDPFDVHIAWSPTSLDTDSMTTSAFITSQYQTVSRFGAKNSRRLAIIYYLLSLNSISIYKPRVPHPINIMYVNQTSLPEGQLWLVSRAIHSHTHIINCAHPPHPPGGIGDRPASAAATFHGPQPAHSDWFSTGPALRSPLACFLRLFARGESPENRVEKTMRRTGPMTRVAA